MPSFSFLALDRWLLQASATTVASRGATPRAASPMDPSHAVLDYRGRCKQIVAHSKDGKNTWADSNNHKRAAQNSRTLDSRTSPRLTLV